MISGDVRLKIKGFCLGEVIPGDLRDLRLESGDGFLMGF